MYLQYQQKLINFLDELKSKLTTIDMDTDTISEMTEQIKDKELLLPVVGGFSAGKSTLLNDFLGTQVLPTGINPETELATELRYSSDERIEAMTLDEQVERFGIHDFEIIKSRAKEFSHLCLYLNNEQLKKIEPLILVDMPGFGSSLANHNKAINYYLPKGAYFIVVTSSEEGNITQSMMRQLGEFDNLNKDFVILLSKANLRSAEQVEELKTYIIDQAEMNFTHPHQVIAIGNESSDELNKVFTSINPNLIFEKTFKDSAKLVAYDSIDSINVKINTLKNDSELNNNTINNLNRVIEDIERQKTRMIREVQDSNTHSISRRCVDHIGTLLNNEADNLGNYLANKNHGAFNETVMGIIREGMSYKLTSEMQTISNEVFNQFKTGTLSELNESMAGFGMGAEWAEQTTTRVRGMLEVTDHTIKKLQDIAGKDGGAKDSATSGAKTIYRAAATTLAVFTGVAAPIVEVALIFLPDIIGFVGKHFEKQKIKESVSSEIIPKIKREISSEISNRIDQHIALMVSNISDSFEAELQEKKVIIEQLEKERNESIEKINQDIAKHEQVKNELLDLTNKTFFVSK